MTKPIQYLLVGFPYSGKTTLAKELEKRLGFSRINIDELKFAKGYNDVVDDDVPDAVWDDIFNEADNLIVKYLSEGKNLANEYAWITREWRNQARKVAKDHGFETKVILIDIPIEDIKRRWLQNKETQERFHWPEDEFEQYIKDFERLTDDENVIIYDQSQSIEKLIDKL